MKPRPARNLASALLLLAMAGCASAPSPVKSTTLAYQVYTGVEGALIVEQQAGHITADQHRALTPFRDAARAALDAASKAALAGDEPAIQAAFRAAFAAVDAYATAAGRMTNGRVSAPPVPIGGQ